MRILHISTRLIIGGSQENTVLSCEGQARRGHDVHLAFGPIHGPEGSMLPRVEAFETADGHGITAHGVRPLVREVAPVRDLLCLRALERLIRAVEPDIVHTHSSKAGILGRTAAWRVGGRAGRIGVVHTIHGPPFHDHETWLRNRMYIAAERWAAKRCHVIVSVSDAMTERFSGHGIGRPGQYITVYSGMELERYTNRPPEASRERVRAELGIPAEAVVIGTVARLTELKGHDDILDGLGAMVREQPSWRLLWVGDGWWRGRLEARIAELGLSDRVVLTGLVEPERVPALIGAMDLLVHPSYREGLPRTVPQALACGVGVVAYDADGTREVCIDRTTGRLVPVGDVDGLGEAVQWMLEDDERRRRITAEGTRLCAGRFGAAAMVESLEAVYDRALRGG